MTPSLDELIKQGEGPQDAIEIGDGIFCSRGIANTYLLTTGDGDVLINTGLDVEAPQIQTRFGRVSGNALRAIVFTQGHPDHVGGWSQFDAPDVDTIAQANHTDVREYWRRLHQYYVRRIFKLWGRFVDHDTSQLPPEPVLTTTFVDSHALDLGGRRIELYSTPGGETTDALVAWLPEERTVFVGNLLGPMFGHVPNLYTIRGDKIRSAVAFMHSVDRVLALEPRVLVNGHEVFDGADEIRRTLTVVRDATAYLRDATIEGMNAGRDLWTLMREVDLPTELALPQLHGKVPWIVRAIWEEHTGWFRYESTTELYAVPQTAVWRDLIELAGGAAAILERAAAYADRRESLQALHLTDIVLGEDPNDAEGRRIKRVALEQLLAEGGRENFSEAQWLESEILETSSGID